MAISLTAWEEDIKSCTSCALSSSRIQAVTASGPAPCDLMFLGEAPGRTEDETGLPFQGQSGRLLDNVLSSLGRPRDTVRVSNAVRCRPPQNRTPTTQEVLACRSHLMSELEAVAPKVVVTLGASAARALGILGTSAALSTVRSQVLEYEGRLLLPTLHPAAVLRSRTKNLPVFTTDLALAVSLSAEES